MVSVSLWLLKSVQISPFARTDIRERHSTMVERVCVLSVCGPMPQWCVRWQRTFSQLHSSSHCKSNDVSLGISFIWCPFQESQIAQPHTKRAMGAMDTESKTHSIQWNRNTKHKRNAKEIIECCAVCSIEFMPSSFYILCSHKINIFNALFSRLCSELLTNPLECHYNLVQNNKYNFRRKCINCLQHFERVASRQST